MFVLIMKKKERNALLLKLAGLFKSTVPVFGGSWL